MVTADPVVLACQLLVRRPALSTLLDVRYATANRQISIRALEGPWPGELLPEECEEIDGLLQQAAERLATKRARVFVGRSLIRKSRVEGVRLGSVIVHVLRNGRRRTLAVAQARGPFRVMEVIDAETLEPWLGAFDAGERADIDAALDELFEQEPEER